ncbi:hypothetical protein Cni_G07707 [Canna indica]|uniref:Uncharacterized protein n=1 Tax=Canna indica TaxID=4628 RepID=A0AAQ3Q756_9LILI|nr:hypothetical protein Cni_G07707 [Canna indica]
MATGWVKSLQCKSNAVDDVVYAPTQSASSSKKPLLSTVSCANSSHAVKDVVFLFPKYPSPSSSSLARKPRPKPRPKQKPKPRPPRLPSSPAASAGLVGPSPHPNPFPTLAELPAGHSSRRVVEIIFSSSWSSSSGVNGGGAAAFPGEIEMLFRVHNPARTVSRFEEHRAAVRVRADSDARCAADGNEMLRFHCGSGSGGVYDAGVARGAVWSARGKVEGVRTFAGSGGAHAGGGGGVGRTAMLVCRVIAGRVRGETDPESEAESVSLGDGELVVLEPSAVLPCFLIIYKI